MAGLLPSTSAAPRPASRARPLLSGRVAETADWRAAEGHGVLPRANEQGREGKLRLADVSPGACAAAARFYDSENRRLYALLARPGAPPEEPRFEPFPDPCPDDAPGGAMAGAGDSLRP